MRVSRDCSHWTRKGWRVASAMAPKSNCARMPWGFVRYWNAGATSPCAINGFAAPSPSSMSSVGGWNVEARDSSLRPGPASSTVTGTPPRTRLAAAVSPIGPAPAMETHSCLDPGLRKPFSASLHRRRPGLEDGVVILLDLVGDEVLGLLRWQRYRLRALQLEPGANVAIPQRRHHLAVELGDDRGRRAFRRQQRKPAGDHVLGQPGLLAGRRRGRGLQPMGAV